MKERCEVILSNPRKVWAFVNRTRGGSNKINGAKPYLRRNAWEIPHFTSRGYLEPRGVFQNLQEGWRSWTRLVSSGNCHWTHWMMDTCPPLDTCPPSNVSSGNFHWTHKPNLKIFTSALMRGFPPNSCCIECK